MTDQEIQIAIAEACGWKWDFNDHKQVYWLNKNEQFGAVHPEPPDYLDDLNAIHEAEKVLCDHTGYWQWIERIQGGPPLKFSLLHATARQRAEAFLRTIGKWKE